MKEFISFQNVVLELTDSCYIDEFALEDIVEFFASGGGEKVYGTFGILLEALSQATRALSRAKCDEMWHKPLLRTSWQSSYHLPSSPLPG